MADKQKDDDRLSVFECEFKALAKKHNLTAISICATDNETGNFLGLLCLDDRRSFGNIFQAIVNIGRLWQHARNSNKQMLDGYEGKW